MRKRIIIMIISVIFFFGMIDLFVVMIKEYKMTEENTILLTATVESVNINDTGDNIYLLINRVTVENYMHCYGGGVFNGVYIFLFFETEKKYKGEENAGG